MGAILKSKMPKGKVKSRRDNTDFTEYAEGGKVGLYENGMKVGGKTQSLKRKMS